MPDEACDLSVLKVGLKYALKETLQRQCGHLCVSQQQQLACDRALAINPRMLIVDGPNEGTQPNIVRHISDVILHLFSRHLSE